MKVICRECENYEYGSFYCKKRKCLGMGEGIIINRCLIPSVDNNKNNCKFFERRKSLREKIDNFIDGVLDIPILKQRS
jgi:hypothetical protein